MNDYQRYYVYTHRDPVTGEIRYVGKGYSGRAWQVGHSKGDYLQYGQRSEDHHVWLKELEAQGFLLDEIVDIPIRGLSEKEAYEQEQQLLKSCDENLLFNKQGTLKYKKSLRKSDKNLQLFAKALHDMGYGYQHTAFLLGAPEPKKRVVSIKRMIAYANE